MQNGIPWWYFQKHGGEYEGKPVLAADPDGTIARHVDPARIIGSVVYPAAILVALLFRTLDSFRIFDNIFILTQGSNGTASVSTLGYDNLFNALNLGIGSTIAVLIFICVAIIAVVFIVGFGTAAPGSDAGKR